MKTERYLVLDPDGHFRWITTVREQILDSFYKAIGCDCVEHVYLPYGFGCVVDESGKIKQHPQKINSLASRFYPGTPFGDPLVGPVIFVRIGLVDGESGWVPIEDRDISFIELITGKEVPKYEM